MTEDIADSVMEILQTMRILKMKQTVMLRQQVWFPRPEPRALAYSILHPDFNHYLDSAEDVATVTNWCHGNEFDFRARNHVLSPTPFYMQTSLFDYHHDSASFRHE